MPTTYTPLATTTLGSANANVTFNDISGAYTDLILIVNGNVTTGSEDISLTFNNDTGNNYSRTVLLGDGSTAQSVRTSNAARIAIAGFSSTIGNAVINIQNYSNNTTNKTVIARGNHTGGGTYAVAGLWRSTSAITTINVGITGSTWTAGSTFSLYGVASAAVVSGAKATGGDTIATDGTYWYHAFRTSGTFTPSSTLSCDVLVIGGGGGGLYAGGGAGGIFYATSQNISNAQTVTIGGGGTGGNPTSTSGVDSTFGSLTAAKGGGQAISSNTGQAGSGGSGAGSYFQQTPGTSIQSSTGGTGYGNSGGTSGGLARGSAGGGGAGAAGSNYVTLDVGAAGGAGLNTWSSWAITTGTGVSGFYAGGGGGAGLSSSGTGGSGGGGAGSTGSAGVAGTANTGGGGGGTWSTNGGNGGSGIIIVRYPV